MRTKQPYSLTKKQLPPADVAYRDNARTCYNILCNQAEMTSLLATNTTAHMRLMDVLKALLELRAALEVAK